MYLITATRYPLATLEEGDIDGCERQSRAMFPEGTLFPNGDSAKATLANA
jgi:hypothetical protein